MKNAESVLAFAQESEFVCLEIYVALSPARPKK